MMASGKTERVTTPDGVSLSVREWGNPAGPEILFIHGVAQSHLCFQRQIESELARGFRLVAFDLRGHGGSDKPADAARYQDNKVWADEIQAVIDAKRLSRPVVVGWSLGGRVIGQYLVVHGDKRLSGINFVSARVIADPRFSGDAMKGLPAVLPYDLESRIAATSYFLRACFHRQPSEKDFAVALAYNMVAGEAVAGAIRGWDANILATEAALRGTRAPVLVTHGQADAVVLPLAAEKTLSLVAGSQASWYDEVGHSPFYEDAPRFNRELAAFVAKVWKPDARRG